MSTDLHGQRHVEPGEHQAGAVAQHEVGRHVVGLRGTDEDEEEEEGGGRAVRSRRVRRRRRWEVGEQQGGTLAQAAQCTQGPLQTLPSTGQQQGQAGAEGN